MTTDERLIRLETQFELFMEEARQQREDIRRLHERQDAAQAKQDAELREIRERQEAAQAKHNADMKAAQEKHDADMKELNQRFYEKFDATDAKIDALRNDVTKELNSNFVQTMIGVGAIMATIGGLIIAALK